MYGQAMQTPTIATDHSKREPEPEQFSAKVLDLTMEELYQAHRALNTSEVLHNLLGLSNSISRGYRLNAFEQKLLDDFISHYTIQYKSPLAQTLKEDV